MNQVTKTSLCPSQQSPRSWFLKDILSKQLTMADKQKKGSIGSKSEKSDGSDLLAYSNYDPSCMDSREAQLRKLNRNERLIAVLRIILVIGFTMLSALFFVNISAQIFMFYAIEPKDSVELAAAVIIYNIVAMLLSVLPTLVIYQKWYKTRYMGWTSFGQWTLVSFEMFGILTLVINGLRGERTVTNKPSNLQQTDPVSRDILAPRHYSTPVIVIGLLILFAHLTLVILMCVLKTHVQGIIREKMLDKQSKKIAHRFRKSDFESYEEATNSILSDGSGTPKDITKKIE